MFISSTCNKAIYCSANSPDYISIKNNSNITVNWINDDNPNDSIWTINGDSPKITDGIISSGSTYRVAVGLEKCGEHFYENSHSEYYFFFNNDIVKTIGWQKITGTDRGLLKRVKVDLDYLRNSNFTITYP